MHINEARILDAAKLRRAMFLKMVRSGEFKNNADLARYFGISRQAMSICLQKARKDEK